MDPCNLHSGEAEAVANCITTLLVGERPANAMAVPGKSTAGILNWPD